MVPAAGGPAPHFHGAFASHYYIQPDQHFYRVPDEVSDSTVAGANCGLTQVLFALREAGLGAGDSLVVQGAGALVCTPRPSLTTPGPRG